MAEIGGYRAQQGLNLPATPRARVDTSTARAVASIGDAVSTLGSQLDRRKKEREALKAANGFDRLEIELKDELQRTMEAAPPDGTGIHQNFMGVYTQKRDAFLGSIEDKQQRERYATILDEQRGANYAKWATTSAGAERDRGYEWTRSELAQSRELMANAISQNPDEYEALLQRGLEVTQNSPIPEAAKRAEQQMWREMARVAYLDRMLQDNPEAVLKDLEADPSLLSPPTIFGMLSNAVRWKETGHIKAMDKRLKAISPAGAIGIMQVMPATAREIALELKDPNFPYQNDETAVFEYLSRRDVNERYGEYYLRKQLDAFDYDIEAALIAYNGGPKRAQAWLKSGRDDSVLPKETKDYYRTIMEYLPGGKSTGGATAQFYDASGNELSSASDTLKNINPALTRRVQQAFSAAGIAKIRVRSAHRDVDMNDAVGGAENSQHLTGNAFDIDVSGLSKAQRVTLIQSLSSMGITGIGVYANTIHADLGSRRAWGPSHHNDSVPDWAMEAINQHLAGTAVAPLKGGIGGNFVDMPYDQRQKYINSAAKATSDRYSARLKSSELDKFNMANLVETELASYLNTGQGTGELDESQIATILGASKYYQYLEDKKLNASIFQATDGIPDMTDQQLFEHEQMHQVDAKSPLWSLDAERVSNAVSDEVARVRNIRARSPGRAALETEELAGLWEQMWNRDPTEITAQEIQSFVQKMLEKQAEFNIKPEAREPLPQEWAIELGRSMSGVPGPSKTRKMSEVSADIEQLYRNWQQVFGPYTDEAILQALVFYNNLDPVVAEQTRAYMENIAVGGNPFRKSAPNPKSEPEGRSFWDWLTGSGEELVPAPMGTQPGDRFIRLDRPGANWRRRVPASSLAPENAETPPLTTPSQALAPTNANAEAVSRATQQLQDDDSPAMHSAIIRRYGQDVYEAARRAVDGN